MPRKRGAFPDIERKVVKVSTPASFVLASFTKRVAVRCHEAHTFSSRKISLLSSRPATIVIEGALMLKLRYGYDRWKHPLIQGVAQIPPDANKVCMLTDGIRDRFK